MNSLRRLTSVKTEMVPRLCWGGRFDAADDVAWHTHAETELVAVTVGKCCIEVDGQRLIGEQGALFVLPAGIAQYQHTLAPTRTTFVGFHQPRGMFHEAPRVLNLNLHDPALLWLEQLCDWPLVRPPLGTELIGQLLRLLLRRIQELDSAQGTRSQLHPAVARALAWMETHHVEPCTLETLAAQTGVSASHLGALFAAQCACSPLQYLQRRRMERAAWLLDNPYMRVNEVAAACGYEDVNYFVRLFSRHYGQPPGRWRQARVNSPKPS